MRKKILVIADDLTGANDTGLQFFKHGLRTNVIMNLEGRSRGAGQNTVQVVNTDSRALKAPQANAKIRAMLSKLQGPRYNLIYKKIDSTLRGNIGSEIDALMDIYDTDVAVMAAAYPAHGRYTIGGYHVVHQSLLEDSEAARDPRSPVHESWIPSILARQTDRRIGHVGIDIVRDASLSLRIQTLLRLQHEIMVFDSVTSVDLERIVNQVFSLKERILWVGSAGLAQALARELTACYVETDQFPKYQFRSSCPALIVTGSLNGATCEQVEELVRQGQGRVLSIPVHVLVADGGLEPYIREATSILQGKQNLVINLLQPSREAKNNTKGDSSLRIACRLGKIACEVILDNPLSGVVLTGGDTAQQTCKHLGITSLHIVDEIEEGIPISLADGNSSCESPIITKAGGFGDKDSFLRAIRLLKQKGEQPYE